MMKKRFWALFLAVMMVVSVLPTTALAAEVEVTEDSICVPGHVHTDECMQCSHTEHTDECYPDGVGKWEGCTVEKNPTHWKNDEHQYSIGDGCWVTTLLALITWDLDVALLRLEGYRFVYYDVPKGTEPTNCPHPVHDESCYKDKVTTAQNHVWEGWVVTQAPTVNAAGSAKNTCTNNPDETHIQTKTLAALNTENGYIYAVTTKPTCTVDGVGTYTHTETGLTFNVAIDMLDHSFTNYVSDGNATCTEDGTKTAKCDRCDATDTIADKGSALDHSFTNYVSDGNATCTEDGTKTAKCDRCDATDTIADEGSALDHDWDVWKLIVEPKVDTEGQIKRICKRDENHYETKTLPMLPVGEDGNFTKSEDYDYEVTTEPGCETTGVGKFTYMEKEDGKIVFTFSFEVEIPALDHIWGPWTVTKAPTVSDKGEAKRICGRDNTHVETKELPVLTLGDNGAYTWTVTVTPTCTTKGIGTYTLKADTTVSWNVELPAWGHKLGEWYTVRHATVTHGGTERRDCERCDYYELRETDRLYHRPTAPSEPSVKVKYLNTKDHVAYIIGYTDGTVQPQGEITRAEIATIYFRLMTDENRENFWTTENGFADVNENDWFNLAVSTLNAAGVIVDVEDDMFRPNDPITRAELAVMAAQFCKVSGKLPETSFKDVDEYHWAYDEIKLIEYAGWIEGYPNGTFRPDNTITRAEAITVINRMLERAVDEDGMLEDMLTFIDCPAYEWYYEAIQEATNSHDYKRTKDEVEDYGYNYEIWTELLAAPDWAAMEKAWIEAR